MTTTDEPRSVPPSATRQAGVFTLAQAREAGLSRGQTSRRTLRGDWVRTAGIAYRAASAPVSTVALLASARLTWPEGVVVGPLAAVHHGAPIERPDVVDVANMPTGTRPLHGLRPHVIPLDASEWHDNGVFRVTDRRRSYVDTLAFTPLGQARRLLAYAFAHEILTRSDLLERRATHPRMHGNGQIALLLRESAAGAWSPAERDAHALLRSHGLLGWSPNARVRDASGRIIAVVDLLFAEDGLAVEINGASAHDGAAALDDARRNRLVRTGWTVLTFSPADLRRRPLHVVSTIQDVIEQLRDRSRAAS